MNLLFFASDNKIGLSKLLVDQLIHLHGNQDLNIVAVSGEKEQSTGISNLLNGKINLLRINGLDVHKDFFRITSSVNQIIINNDIYIVHVQNNWQLAIAGFVKYFLRRRIKIIYTIHGFRHNHLIKSLIARIIIAWSLLLLADMVIAPSSELKRKFKLIRYKCRILYLGVNEEFFKLNGPDYFLAKRNLIFTGQFRNGKNQAVIINALSRYISKTGNQNVNLILPGEGPLLNYCKHLTEDLNIQSFVEFPGLLDIKSLIRIYKQCHVAVIATNYETFGHCIAEPFVAGLCVITRKTGIAGDIIREKENGLFFDTSEDLVQLFENYLGNADELRNLGRSAIKARDVLHWNVISDKYAELIADL